MRYLNDNWRYLDENQRKDAFKGKALPSKLTDLFDLKTFPGRRALQKQPQGNLEWALLAVCDSLRFEFMRGAANTPIKIPRANVATIGQ